MFFVLLFFYNSTSTNAYSLGIRHYHQDNVRLANDIDSVTLHCAFFLPIKFLIYLYLIVV